MYSLHKLLNEYTGPKIHFVGIGGAVSFAQILSIPGSSKIIKSVLLPYDADAVSDICFEGYPFSPEKWVSQETVQRISESMTSETLNPEKPYLLVVCSAALTTNRWRKGDNHAHVCIRKSDGSPKFHHFKLLKLDEDIYNDMNAEDIAFQRRNEDKQLVNYIVNEILEL